MLKNNLFFLFNVFASLTASVVMSSAYADEQDTLNFIAGVSSRYEDNLFRQVNNEQSDVINALYAGLNIDKQYSLQHFKLSARITKNLYRTNDYLDWNNKQYSASWGWSITPRLKGTLSASRTESLLNFNDTQSTAQNIQTNRNESFLFDYNAFGGWHILGGASHLNQKNSQTFNQDASFTSKAFDFGVRYDFRSGSDLTVMNHLRRGENDDRQFTAGSVFDNEFREKETEATLNWLLSAKSTVRANIGYYKREHENLSTWDYDGLQGSVGYQWSPTGKIQVNVDLSSRLGTFQTFDSSYSRLTSFSISPVYQYSPKISFNSALVISKRDFLGSGAVGLSTTNPRDEDDFYSISMGANWKPWRSTTLGIVLSHQKNDSNNDQFDYKAKSARVSGNFVF